MDEGFTFGLVRENIHKYYRLALFLCACPLPFMLG